MPRPARRHPLSCYLVANLRVFVLLWRRFRLSLTLFAVLVVGGSLVLWWAYTFPESGQQLSYPQALYAIVSMLFFESVVPLPHGALQILFFAVPLLGLTVIVEGLVRFSLLLLDRRNPSGEWTVALASTYSGHVIVCGLGHLGYRVIRQLVSYGQEVVGIERDPQSPFLERIRRLGVPILMGDATDEAVLQQVGIERAAAVVVATNNDMMNLEVVLNLRELNPDIRLVMRMFDADLAQKVGETFGIRTAFSTSNIAAPAFATAAIHEGVTHSFFLEGELMHISEVIVHPEGRLSGLTIGELERQLDISVVFHQRQGVRDMHPRPDLTLGSSDKVVVFCSLEQLNQLEQLNCPPRGRSGRARRAS